MEHQYFVGEGSSYEGNSREMKKFSLIRWKSGKSIDPRLFTLLEMFKKLYVEKHEFFKQIFPVHYNEFEELFKKIGGAFSTRDDDGKARTVARSLSFGSSGVRMERFKVRTPDIREVQSSGQGDNKSNIAS